MFRAAGRDQASFLLATATPHSQIASLDARVGSPAKGLANASASEEKLASYTDLGPPAKSGMLWDIQSPSQGRLTAASATFGRHLPRGAESSRRCVQATPALRQIRVGFSSANGSGETNRAPLLAVRAGDYLGGAGLGPPVCQRVRISLVAASYCLTTLAGMRPRSLTVMPASSPTPGYRRCAHGLMR